MKTSSKAKGNWNEWEICRALSLWLTDGTDKTQLVRSVQSGGHIPLRLASFPQVGDIAPNGPAGEKFRSLFGVECKCGKTEPDWWGFKSENWCVKLWWSKIKDECAPHHLSPLLIMKRNHQPMVVTIEMPLFIAVDPPVQLILPKLEAAVITFDDFKAVSPESWYMGAKTVRGILGD